jgi:hypothetical protein
VSNPDEGRENELAPIDRALVALGAALLGFTLQISDGFYRPVAYPSFCLAIACATGGLLGAGRWLIGAGPGWSTVAVLAMGLSGNFVILATSQPAYYLKNRWPWQHPWYLLGIVTAAILTLLIGIDDRRRRIWFPALLGVFLCLGIWLIRASPDPYIDVMTVQRAAIDALWRGQSPYSIAFRNIYGSDVFYGADVVKDSLVHFGLPYPPLSLLMAVPGQLLLGDLRYAELVALIAGCGAIGYAGRDRGAPLAAALVLFTPRTFFVLEQGWTEAFVICWLGITVATATTRSSNRGLVLALLCAVKQHMVVALAFAPWLVDRREDGAERKALVFRALAIATALSLPFVLWDPAGFWRSVVWLQFQEPMRPDSLSMLSLIVHAGWSVPRIAQTVAPLLALAMGVAVSFRCAPRTPAGFALAIGVSFLLMFAFSKKAFCNYYFFVLAALATSVAASREDRSPVGIAGS